MVYLEEMDFSELKSPYKKDPKIFPYALGLESGANDIDQLPVHIKLEDPKFNIEENRSHFRLNAITAVFIRDFHQVMKEKLGTSEATYSNLNEAFDFLISSTLESLSEWEKVTKESSAACPHLEKIRTSCLEELRYKILPDLENIYGIKLGPIATNIFRGMFTALDIMIGFIEVIKELYQKDFQVEIPQEILIETLKSKAFRQQLKDIASLKSSTLSSLLDEVSYRKRGQNRSAFRPSKFFLVESTDQDGNQKIDLKISRVVSDNFETHFTSSASDIATKCPGMIKAKKSKLTVIDEVLETVIKTIQ